MNTPHQEFKGSPFKKCDDPGVPGTLPCELGQEAGPWGELCRQKDELGQWWVEDGLTDRCTLTIVQSAWSRKRATPHLPAP